jgi:hypothetical protein
MTNVMIEMPSNVGIAYASRRRMNVRKVPPPRNGGALSGAPISNHYFLIHQVWTLYRVLNGAGAKFCRLFCETARVLFA